MTGLDSKFEQEKPLKAERKKIIEMISSIVIMIIILFLPLEGITVVGHRVLAIAAFAVVVWVTECISYPLSSFAIASLITFLVGFAPDPNNSANIIGLSKGLIMAVSGWESDMTWFILCSLILALGMNVTGLDRRITLWIVSRFHTYKGVLIGSMIAMDVLAFLIPSSTARTAAMVPIIMGIISVFKQSTKSQFAAAMGVGLATISSTSQFGILTGSAPNVLVASFVEQATGVSMSWMQFFVLFFPYMVIMTIAAYFIVKWIFKSEVDEVPGGKDSIKQMYTELGPWTSAQKRVAVLFAITIFFWASNGVLFNLNLTAVTIVAALCFMLPGIGVISWETAQNRLNWGTVLLFATGMGIGILLVQTKAALWLADVIFGGLGVSSMPVLLAAIAFSIIAVLLHFGFSSSTSLCATYLPMVISYIQANNLSNFSLVGIPFIILIATGVTLLPVNSANTIVAFGTNTFTQRQFFIVNIINAVASLIMIVVFSATYWHWLGII